jgi:hypothetical protein
MGVNHVQSHFQNVDLISIQLRRREKQIGVISLLALKASKVFTHSLSVKEHHVSSPPAIQASEAVAHVSEPMCVLLSCPPTLKSRPNDIPNIKCMIKDNHLYQLSTIEHPKTTCVP